MIAVDIMFNRVYLLTMHISYCLIWGNYLMFAIRMNTAFKGFSGI